MPAYWGFLIFNPGVGNDNITYGQLRNQLSTDPIFFQNFTNTFRFTGGISGTNGVNGTNGVDGTNGLNGADGSTGATGATGPTGPQGSAGVNGTNSSVLFIVTPVAFSTNIYFSNTITVTNLLNPAFTNLYVLDGVTNDSHYANNFQPLFVWTNKNNAIDLIFDVRFGYALAQEGYVYLAYIPTNSSSPLGGWVPYVPGITAAVNDTNGIGVATITATNILLGTNYYSTLVFSNGWVFIERDFYPLTNTFYAFQHNLEFEPRDVQWDLVCLSQPDQTLFNIGDKVKFPTIQGSTLSVAFWKNSLMAGMSVDVDPVDNPTRYSLENKLGDPTGSLTPLFTNFMLRARVYP